MRQRCQLGKVGQGSGSCGKAGTRDKDRPVSLHLSGAFVIYVGLAPGPMTLWYDEAPA